MTKTHRSFLLHPAVIVSALGYFVDIYDLLLFSIVRIPSLTELGLQGPELFDRGLLLINLQMAGMLVGGVLWGILGDKKGRISVLFGSILLYSVANVLNGFVHSVEAYAVLRFIAGIGLAGELGAGVTLVSEILPKEIRGLGTTLVASFGVCGAVLAAIIGESFHWRTAYFIGGGLGLALLLLRYGVIESGLFSRAVEKNVSRGNFWMLFARGKTAMKYLRCIFVGVPIWFVIGILVTFAPEFAKHFGVTDPVSGGRAVLFAYVGLSLGDLSSGLLSQMLKSRKKAIFCFLVLTAIGTLTYLFVPHTSSQSMYLTCLLLGVAVGYWAVFVTVGAEQFGTNLRATVATTVPNFVRGSLVLISAFFTALKPSLGLVHAALMVGGVTIVVAMVSLFFSEETFGKDLDYLEEHPL